MAVTKQMIFKNGEGATQEYDFGAMAKNVPFSFGSNAELAIASLIGQPFFEGKPIRILTKYTQRPEIEQIIENGQRIFISNPWFEVNFLEGGASNMTYVAPSHTGIHYLNFPMWSYPIDGGEFGPPGMQFSKNRNEQPEGVSVPYISCATINSPDGVTWDESSFTHLFDLTEGA